MTDNIGQERSGEHRRGKAREGEGRRRDERVGGGEDRRAKEILKMKNLSKYRISLFLIFS